MERILAEERLDRLPPSDPRATRSRADLRRLNFLMRHARIIGRGLRLSPSVKNICDLGGGDGAFMLAVARHIGWRDVHLTIVDRHDSVPQEIGADFTELGWRVSVVVQDFATWSEPPQSSPVRFDAITANLVLHHLSEAELGRLFAAIETRTRLFVACDPRRGSLGLLAARCLGLIGCNDVTRHDARVSVRAGFAGQELTRLWPSAARWQTTERAAGLFSHLFVARRI